jgi:hypothetical protein
MKKLKRKKAKKLLKILLLSKTLFSILKKDILAFYIKLFLKREVQLKIPRLQEKENKS